MKFNPGDKVTCVNAKDQRSALEEGKIYDVLGAAEGNVYIQSSKETAPRWFWDSRFELADSKPQQPEKRREKVAENFANEVLYHFTKEKNLMTRRLEQKDISSMLNSEVDLLKIKIRQSEHFIQVIKSLMAAYEIELEDEK